MEIEEIKNLLKNKLSDYLNGPGSIIYSSVETIRKGDYYILGLNPGGIPDKQTIANCINTLDSKTINSYVDEEWDWRGKKLKKGEHPFQKALKEITKNLNTELKDIFASNLIFIRTRKGKEIKDYDSVAPTFWQVHEYLIKEIVKPKVIFAIGNSESLSSYSFLKKVNISSIITESSKQHKNVKFKSFTTSQYKVIGLPHLSRFSWIINGKNGETFFNWLKNEMNLK